MSIRLGVALWLLILPKRGKTNSKLSVPVYVNVSAEPVSAGDASREALVAQVSRPVRWDETVRRMVEDGVTLFVEIGPGRVLTGLLRRIDKSVKGVSVQTPADFEAARAAIAEARG